MHDPSSWARGSMNNFDKNELLSRLEEYADQVCVSVSVGVYVTMMCRPHSILTHLLLLSLDS